MSDMRWFWSRVPVIVPVAFLLAFFGIALWNDSNSGGGEVVAVRLSERALNQVPPMAAAAAPASAVGMTEKRALERVAEAFPSALPTESGIAYVPGRALCHPESGWTENFDAAEFAKGIEIKEIWERYGAWQKLENMYTASGTRNRGSDPATPNNFQKFEALGPVGPHCKKLESLATGDDEKKICGLAQLDRPGCVIISLGSAGQFAFEESVLKHTKHCVVHIYDCTGSWPVPEHLRSRVTMHEICIASKARKIKGRTYVTYTDVLKMSQLDDNHPPAHLKMDIEGWEYDVMRSLFTSKDIKMLPQQISLEIHWATWGAFEYTGNIAASELMLFASAFYRAGYVFIDSRPNPGCFQCIEVTLFRVFC